jgi:hypothetical protein
LNGGKIMRFRIVSLIVLLTFMTALFGCATIPEEHKGAATGAGIGAIAGVTAGALLGSSGAKTEMAVLGGLMGALAGGLIGHYAYDKKKDEQETASTYSYNSSKGVKVQIEDIEAVPKQVLPGETVNIRTTYALLGAGSDTAVTEIREIRFQGSVYAKPEVKVYRDSGTYSSTLPIIMPHDAKKGKYTVIVSVKAGKAKASKETSFSVN